VYLQCHWCKSFTRSTVLVSQLDRSQRLVPIIPIDLNVTLNTNVCSVCAATYNNINDLFLQMAHADSRGVCMDIVDTVRHTILCEE
jgi:hypothetical protein